VGAETETIIGNPSSADVGLAFATVEDMVEVAPIVARALMGLALAALLAEAPAKK
jgi:hypothetical protein